MKLSVAYSKAIKYGADESTVNNLMNQLAHPKHEDDRLGNVKNSQIRQVTADALRDNDREHEADLLADPKQHVVIQNGKVYPGMFSLDKLQNAVDTAHRHWRNHLQRNRFMGIDKFNMRILPHKKIEFSDPDFGNTVLPFSQAPEHAAMHFESPFQATADMEEFPPTATAEHFNGFQDLLDNIRNSSVEEVIDRNHPKTSKI